MEQVGLMQLAQLLRPALFRHFCCQLSWQLVIGAPVESRIF